MGKREDVARIRRELQGYLDEKESEYKIKSREVARIADELTSLRAAVSGLSGYLGTEEKKPRQSIKPRLPGDNQRVRVKDSIEQILQESETGILTVAEIVNTLHAKGMVSGKPHLIGTFTGILNHDDRFFHIDTNRYCLAGVADYLTDPGFEGILQSAKDNYSSSDE